MDAGNVVLLLLGLITVGAAILGVFHMVGRQHQRIEREWTKAARAVGGRVDIPSGFRAGTAYEMRANLEGPGVVKLLGAQGPTETGSALTRHVRARSPSGRPPPLDPQGPRVLRGQSAGTKDVEIGEPAFDELVVVTTNDESGARSWLTPKSARSSPGPTRILRCSILTLSRAMPARRAPASRRIHGLEAAIRAVAALASRGRGMEERTEPRPPLAGTDAAASLSAMRIQ